MKRRETCRFRHKARERLEHEGILKYGQRSLKDGNLFNNKRQIYFMHAMKLYVHMRAKARVCNKYIEISNEVLK